MAFQLTASRRGWHFEGDSDKKEEYFNSQPHEEADADGYKLQNAEITFQLTASRRGWLDTDCFEFCVIYFNSPPHDAADDALISPTTTTKHFNSQPHEEADWVFEKNDKWYIYFNSQPHEEADLPCTHGSRVLKYFNSQPHEEADYSPWFCECGLVMISTHSLTKRLTDNSRIAMELLAAFQLTASRRGWHLLMSWKLSLKHFNSQPHEEADGNFRQKYIYLKLFFTLIAHINLVFYSNHYIVNFFLVKYTHFLVRMSWSISVSLPFAL